MIPLLVRTLKLLTLLAYLIERVMGGDIFFLVDIIAYLATTGTRTKSAKGIASAAVTEKLDSS